MDPEIELEVVAQHRTPQDALRNGFVDRGVQNLRLVGELATDVDDRSVCSNRIGGKGNSLEQQVRIGTEHFSVLKRAWLRFVGVADHEFLLPHRLVGELPFQAGGKSPLPRVRAGWSA